MPHVTGRGRDRAVKNNEQLLKSALHCDPTEHEVRDERVRDVQVVCRRFRPACLRELVTLALNKSTPTRWELEILADGYNAWREDVGQLPRNNPFLKDCQHLL